MFINASAGNVAGKLPNKRFIMSSYFTFNSIITHSPTKLFDWRFSSVSNDNVDGIAPLVNIELY